MAQRHMFSRCSSVGFFDLDENIRPEDRQGQTSSIPAAGHKYEGVSHHNLKCSL
jgi:hypothetical protein